MKIRNKAPLLPSILMCGLVACSPQNPAEHPLAQGASAENMDRPNILLIYADDMGYGDLSIYGQTYFETPHMDALARDGILFTQHYSGSTVCLPSRNALMTGQNTGHISLRGNGAFELPEEDTTIATLLQAVGYRTAHIGKSCVTGNVQTPETLARHGFEYFFGTTAHPDAHFRYPEFVYENTERVDFPNNHLHHGSDYDLDFYRDKTLEYLKAHDNTAPFFLLLSLSVPHASINVPEDSMARVRANVQPDNPERDPRRYTYVEEPRASYAGLVTRIDDAVGEIVETLRELGQLENTLIILTSDNGPHAEGGYHPDWLQSAGPLRGHKRDLYEGGIRVPMIAHWPARITPGQETDHPSAQWDFLPTACEVAGVPVPKDIQGLSFLPTLTGEGNQAEHPYLYWEFHEMRGRRALRAGDWKVVQYDLETSPQGAIELYNLAEDIGESTNLAKKHPEIVERLTKKMAAARVPSERFPLPSLDSLSRN